MNEQILDQLRFWGVEERHLVVACHDIFSGLNNEYDCDTLQSFLDEHGYLIKEHNDTN